MSYGRECNGVAPNRATNEGSGAKQTVGKNQPSRRSVLCSLLTGFANAGDAEQDGEGSGSEIERREGRTTTL
jgi:hypothetical protein